MRMYPLDSPLRSLATLGLLASLCSFAVGQATPADAPPATAMANASPAPATVPPLKGIAHIAIRVKDLQAAMDFYHKLGFEQPFDMKRGDVTTQAFIKINDRQYIELYPVDERNSQVGFLHLCFEGGDLNPIHDYYVAEGLTPIAVRKAGAGNMLFTLKGPQQFWEPQNIEYTQYMPGSRHSNDFGQHLGPDRVGDKMTVVALAMQDSVAARSFYLDKLGFKPSSTNPDRLDLPGGDSGEQVEIVPVSELGPRSSIVLSTPDLNKAEAQLKRQQVVYKRASASATDGKGKMRTVDMISVTDPDGNVIRIQQAQ
jgi:catechol 2,3-dioxygenase-like lactoylglutathione lyase family enzyme